MDTDTHENLMAAAKLLIKEHDGPPLYRMMVECAVLMHKYHELRFVGAAEPLTTLGAMKVRNNTVFQGVIDLIERKRKEVGYAPLDDKPEKGFDKDAYMAEFMQQKRLRLRRAAELENMRRPERDRLVGKPRLEFMDRQSALWATQREEFLERAKQSAGGRLSKAQREEVVAAFWTKIDNTMDALEDSLRNKGPGVSAAELEAVLRHDPYKS